jgi:tetratricopeptide (TPR) repeat protein
MRSIGRILVLASLMMATAGFGRTPYWQGNDRFNKREYQGAIEAYTRAITADSLSFPAWFHRGMAHERLNELDAALADYERAIRIVPGFGLALHYRGHVHTRLAAHELAIADYDQALATAGEVQVDAQGVTMQVDKASVYYDRGNAYFRLGRYNPAIASYDSSLMLAPRFAAAYNNRGASKLNLGDRAGACVDREKGCELGYTEACTWVRDSCGTH